MECTPSSDAGECWIWFPPNVCVFVFAEVDPPLILRCPSPGGTCSERQNILVVGNSFYTEWTDPIVGRGGEEVCQRVGGGREGRLRGVCVCVVGFGD